MCTAVLKKPLELQNKVHGKLLDSSPVMRRVEASTGYRPHGIFGVHKALGIKDSRRKNLYFRPGAKGNPGG